MKTKLFFILLTVLTSTILTAQSSKKKKESIKTEDAIQVAEISIADVGSSSESSSVSPSSFEALNNIRYNNKFEVYGSINDQYDFYCEKYAKNKYNSLGIADKSGNVILPHLFSKSYGNSSNSNEVLLYMNNNYGVFDLNELRWSILMEYDGLSFLNNNLYKAKKNGKWGIIDNNNTVIVPFNWYQISNISNLENYIIVTANTYPNKLKGIYSLMERKLTVPCAYTELTKLSNQDYFLAENGTKHNIVDISNTPRFKKWYDDITVPSKGRNYYIVKNDNKYGVIDDNEKEIIPIEYLEFAQYPYSDGSYLARNKDGKYGFVLIDGKVTLPFEYDNLIKNYNDNIVSVQNGKCGLIQVNSGMPYQITTCNYDDIKGGNKTFIVEKDGKFGLLDIYGKQLTEIEFQSLESLDNNSNDGSIFKAQKDGYYQLIDKQGKPIGTEKFQDISIIEKKNISYYSDVKFTYMKGLLKNGKYSIIDKVGKTISSSLFDDIISENDNNFIVKSKGKYGLYSLLDQKLIIDYKYDLIIKTSDNYWGFYGKKIDILIVKSGQVTKINTTK
ncbi:MAG: WG repeat-containing protein [Bacteroidota bacterium]|nr:WG repeat-containing protein [Bacteroidota bacterium]